MARVEVNSSLRVLVALFVCWCVLQGRCDAASNGFLSEAELETAATNGEGMASQNRVQFLFPAINFTGSVSITEWTFVASDLLSMNSNTMGAAFPQLQVWRPGTLVVGSFSLQSSTGSMSELRGSGPLYRYEPATPISVMPGDVLGIYIPRVPLLLPRFRDVGEGNTFTYFFQPANEQPLFFTANNLVSGSRLIPFVAVELVSLAPSSTIAMTTTSSALSQTSANSFTSTLGLSSTLLQPIPPSSPPTKETAAPSSSELVSSPSASALEETSVMPSTSALEISLSTSQFATIQSAVSMPVTVVETVGQGIPIGVPTTVLITSQPITSSPSLMIFSSLPILPTPLASVAAVLSSSSLVTQEPTPPVTQANNSTVMVVAAVGAVFAILILVLVVILVTLLVLNNRRRKKQLKDVASTSILEARGSPASGLGHLDNPVYQGVVVKNDSPTVTVSSSYDHSDMHNSSVLYQTATSLELWNDLYQTHHTIEDKEQSGIYHEANHTPSDVIQNSIYHEALTQSTDDEGHYEMASPYELPVVCSSAQPAEQQVPVHYEQLATTEASTSSSQTGVTTEAPGHYEFPATAVSVTTELPHPAATGLAASYEQPATTSAASNSVESAVTSHIPAHYEQPTTALATKSGGPTEHHYSMLDQNGIYVPSEEERAALGITEECSVFDENCYSEWGKNQAKSDVDKMTFFEQCDIYWRPATQASVLYDQLAKKKYREIKRSDIQIIRHLGSGQFGTVNEGVWHCPWGKQQVAVKMLRVRAVEQEKVKLLQEAAIMGQFVHPNVVRLHGVVTVGEPMMIAIELMTKGDLTNYLRSIRANPSQRSATSLPGRLVKACRQVTAGMVYLSKKCFVHRDLAARNVLVNENETCKIGDFGMSRDLEDEHYYVSHGGKIPVKWTAPEALHYKKYSTASDVWSFGVLMYEIWSLGHKPFEEFTNPMAIKLIESGYRLPPPPGCPKAMYQLMMECWHPDGSHRPTFSSVLSTLSLPLSQLLHWSDGDRAAHQHADCLGGSLEIGQYLYQDIQHTYFNSKKHL